MRLRLRGSGIIERCQTMLTRVDIALCTLPITFFLCLVWMA